MMKKRYFSGLLVGTVLSLFSQTGNAKVVPAPIFSDGMILQQESKIPVWGMADPGEKIQVDFGSEKLQTKADGQGNWIVYLKARKANDVPEIMTLKGKDHTVQIRDILVGEVVLAGGQSNMEVPIKESENPEKSAAEANDPMIREFKVLHDFDVKVQEHFNGKWVAVSPETAPDICAVSYYYARKIRQALNVPVGIVNNAYSSSPAQSWLSEEALR